MNNSRDRLTTEDLARRAEYDGRSEEDRVSNRGESFDELSPAEGDAARRDEEPLKTPVQDRTVLADAPRVERAEAADRQREPVREAAREARNEARNEERMQLFEQDEMTRMRGRWSDIQAGFVDEPRKAVELADSLVAETMQRLAQMFSEARHDLERQWDRGENVTTEDLRLTLQRYRSFFDRLLSM